MWNRCRRFCLQIGVAVALALTFCPQQAIANDFELEGVCEPRGVESLSTNQEVDEGLVSMLHEAIVAHDDKVAIGQKYNTNEVWAALDRINDMEPVFYFDTATVYRYDDDSVAYVTLEYLFNGAEFVEAKKRYDEAIEDALKWTSNTRNDMENAKALHDYLVRHVSYDHDNYLQGTIPATSYSAYGALVCRRAVCSGYARAYVDLLRRCGIEARVVSSNTMNHAWCVVEIGTKSFHVDCTWDDPVPDGGWGREPDSTYFMKSDQAFLALDHYGWDADGIVCSDSSLDDYVWPVFSQAVRPYYNFTDLSSTWYLPAVEFGMEEGITKGVDNNRWAPDSSLTRAQAAVIITRALAPSEAEKGNQSSTTGFSDVEARSWFTSSVNYCVGEGILKGADGRFRPYDEMTREELCVVLSRVRRKQTNAIWPYSSDALFRIADLPEEEQPSSWARYSVLELLTEGVIGNGPQLDLHSSVTRAEALTMIMNSVEKGVIQLA